MQKQYIIISHLKSGSYSTMCSPSIRNLDSPLLITFMLINESRSGSMAASLAPRTTTRALPPLTAPSMRSLNFGSPPFTTGEGSEGEWWEGEGKPPDFFDSGDSRARADPVGFSDAAGTLCNNHTHNKTSSTYKTANQMCKSLITDRTAVWCKQNTYVMCNVLQ